VVIFGVTGDLSRKKLMPAIYDLANRGLLPPGFALVGFARRDWEDENFAELVHDAGACHSNCVSRRCTKIGLSYWQPEGAPRDRGHIAGSVIVECRP
jgi:glucose-6-phosphate 1-dehydrogenase